MTLLACGAPLHIFDFLPQLLWLLPIAGVYLRSRVRIGS